jgi:hypothetical protein
MRRFVRSVLAVLLPVAVLAVLGAAATLWVDQQGARARLAEQELQPLRLRAEAAEARAARAEASLTAVAQQRLVEASATATTVARATDPQRALERALGRLFAVYQEPLGQGYNALSEVFGPSALNTMKPEADYLRVTGRQLGGISTFTVESAAPLAIDQDTAEVRTRERWTYDERDANDRRQRCFVEDSDQTYVMKRAGEAWMVEEVRLGATRRTDCPAG